MAIDTKVAELLRRCRADYANARQSVDDLAQVERRSTTMEEKLRQQQCTTMIDWIDYVMQVPPEAPRLNIEMITGEVGRETGFDGPDA